MAIDPLTWSRTQLVWLLLCGTTMYPAVDDCALMRATEYKESGRYAAAGPYTFFFFAPPSTSS